MGCQHKECVVDNREIVITMWNGKFEWEVFIGLWNVKLEMDIFIRMGS